MKKRYCIFQVLRSGYNIPNTRPILSFGKSPIFQTENTNRSWSSFSAFDILGERLKQSRSRSGTLAASFNLITGSTPLAKSRCWGIYLYSLPDKHVLRIFLTNFFDPIIIPCLWKNWHHLFLTKDDSDFLLTHNPKHLSQNARTSRRLSLKTIIDLDHHRKCHSDHCLMTTYDAIHLHIQFAMLFP